jgi:hypothetical protein
MNTGPVRLFNLPREKWGCIDLMIALDAYLFRLKQTQKASGEKSANAKQKIWSEGVVK